MAIIEDGLLVLMLSIMIMLAGGQIIARNFFDSGFAWGEPTLRVLVLWVALLGAMAATRDEHHISIDILSRLLKPQYLRYTTSISTLFTAAVCGLITWYSARFVYMEWQDGGLLFGTVPAWLSEIIIPFGFAMITIRSLTTTYYQLFRRSHTVQPRGQRKAGG